MLNRELALSEQVRGQARVREKEIRKLSSILKYIGLDTVEGLLDCYSGGSNCLVPGICWDCDTVVTEVKMDCSDGWCKKCKSSTVRSCLYLVLGGK